MTMEGSQYRHGSYQYGTHRGQARISMYINASKADQQQHQ